MSQNLSFKIPEDFINEKVAIFLNIPIQGKQGEINFPAFECTILEQLDGALRVKDSKGDTLLPYHQIQSIRKQSAVQTVSSIVVPQNLRGPKGI